MYPREPYGACNIKENLLLFDEFLMGVKEDIEKIKEGEIDCINCHDKENMVSDLMVCKGKCRIRCELCGYVWGVYVLD